MGSSCVRFNKGSLKIAVIGTGTMGTSIAQVFAQCEKTQKVYLCKGRESSKSDGKNTIEKGFNRLVAKGKIQTSDMKLYLSRIETGPIEIAGDADLVIEAVMEDLQIKKAVFKKLDAICDKKTLFATNTSSIPISLIGKDLSRPLLGMHFFNPVSSMRLVEIITDDKCPRCLIDTLICIAREIGKETVEVKQSPGFVVNRLLIPMINEAIGIYAEGIASAKDIDLAMELGANHPMGPLKLCDLIGLDVVLAIMEVMLDETGNTKYCPETLLRKMVQENRLGKKTGEGFYKY